MFYFVRANLSVAMPVMKRELHFDNALLGSFQTMQKLLYGVSKFLNGFFGDRANGRKFMVVGLVGSAVLNVFFGFSSTAVAFGLLWLCNGWFQGMGFPPCARLMTNWFSPKVLASKFSIWNTSHCIGGGLVVILCGYLVTASWRYCFWVPGGLALVCAVFLSRMLPDTPPSVGLPEVAGTQGASGRQTGPEFRALVMERVFRNKWVWLISFSNFFIYIIRYAVFDWGPTLLTENKHYHIQNASWMMAGFECAGAVGAMIAGWMTDRFFGGRAVRVAAVAMALAGVSVFLFWKIPHQTEWSSALLLCSTGFFIYCPQCLVAIAVANLSTKRAAATAIGLTSIFASGSSIFSGWGLGRLLDYAGWDAVFAGLLIAAALGVGVLALAWPAQVHGYEEKAEG